MLVGTKAHGSVAVKCRLSSGEAYTAASGFVRMSDKNMSGMKAEGNYELRRGEDSRESRAVLYRAAQRRLFKSQSEFTVKVLWLESLYYYLYRRHWYVMLCTNTVVWSYEVLRRLYEIW